MKADGSILIDTKIVDGGMEKGFELIKDEMASVGLTAKEVGEQIELSFSKMDVSKPIAKAFEKVKSLQSQFENIDLNFQGERDKLKQMEDELNNALKFAGDDADFGFDLPLEEFQRYKDIVSTLPKEIEKQKNVVDSLEKKWTSTFNAIEASSKHLTEVISAEVQKQAAAEEKAAKKAEKAAEKEAAAKQRIAEKQFRDLTKPARRFNTRLREIISGALVFNLLSAGLREMTSYFGTALKANTEFSASFAQLKGALLTAFQPIYEVVLPAVIYLMKILTALAQVVGNFFSAITGKNSAQMAQNAKALNNQAAAIGGVGDAAEEASKQLAGFDEINRLETTSAASGGGGGTGSGEIAPNFEPVEITEDLEKILALVGAIGAGLLAWKIASMFTDSLSVAAGIGLAVGGALQFAYNWADAFANGISWDNLSGMLLGVVAVVGGLALAFGATGAAVGLLISGFALVVLSLREWIETGELSKEAATALVIGIMAIGAAIAILTGSWIPLLVAGLVSAVALIVARWEEISNYFSTTFADGLWNGIVKMLGDIGEWVLGWLNDFVNWISEKLSGLWSFFTGNTFVAGEVVANPVSYSTAPAIAAYSVTPEVPYLAKGAVIPPNKQFMAVLGDQRNGRNLEGPEDLFRQIVREESGAVNSDRLAQLLETLISVVEAIEVGDETIGRAAARYNRSASRARGY